MIDFKSSTVTVTGDLWTGEAKRKLREASADAVRRLGEEGYELVRDGMPNVTGQTRAGLELYQKYDNSLFARVRMKGKDDIQPRGKGSALYPARRVPYIIAAVLESGRYGGHSEYRVRVGSSGRARMRKKWVRGARTRHAYRMFALAERVLKREAARIKADFLTRDWRV